MKVPPRETGRSHYRERRLGGSAGRGYPHARRGTGSKRC
jgi:hypothetical protein